MYNITKFSGKINLELLRGVMFLCLYPPIGEKGIYSIATNQIE